MQIDYVIRSFDDFDQESKCMAAYDQEYRQLSKGRFRGVYQAIHMGPELTFHFEQNNRVLEQNGVTPNDQYTIIFLLNEGVPSRLNGRTFSHEDLYICGPQSTFDTVGHHDQWGLDEGLSGPHFVAISVQRSYFEAEIMAADPTCDPAHMLNGAGLWLTGGNRVRTLRRGVSRLLGDVRRARRVDERAAPSIRARTTEFLAHHLRSMVPPTPDAHLLSWSRPYRLVARARELMEDARDTDVSIGSLCRDLGVSRRTVEYCFRDEVGLSPVAYMRSLKLHRVRRALMTPENADRSIGDLAAEAGFWHTSRFSAYYRDQFGELPSRTRMAGAGSLRQA
ncbi:MAG: helix-turn-helix domain-containing protein [Pseudomonadota bacterium]